DVPILVGGAALTRKFTRTRIAPEYEGMVLYAKDAMEGLDLANKLSDPEQRQMLVNELRESMESAVMESGKQQDTFKSVRAAKSSVSQDTPVYIPPDLERHVLRDYPIDHIYPYVNMRTLLGHHLGLRGNVDRLLESKDPKAVALKETVDELFAEAKAKGMINAQGMYRFFPAQSDGDDIIIYDPADVSK